ncbi:MAG: rRNA cytosine-C5-methyltransferase [Actinobacteria bacterium]|nr:rRNA cytosine-C5-methyltransferase [Actinomycetota bacterium]
MTRPGRRGHRVPGKRGEGAAPKPAPVTTDPRALALAALVRIEEGAYANLVLGPMLAASGMDQRDRGFSTELVYGTTRMRRACDHLIDPYLLRPLDAPTRSLLRLGAYQLHFMKVPAHAAVSATVAVAPHRTRGFVNAVLRRVAESTARPSDLATELSYPDWLVERLIEDLGAEDARAALVQMNEPAEVNRREDGYIQDLGSQWVADAVGAERGERVLDLCAAPGGKATAMAHAGAHVVAADLRAQRAGLVAANAAASAASGVSGWAGGGKVSVVIADGRRPPWSTAAFDRVLVDAPCSGLGVLRRRPDARWRVQPGDAERLAGLQRELLVASMDLLRPGGTLVYSVCTLTRTETLGIDDWLAAEYPWLEPLAVLGSPWRPHGRGSLLLPQSEGTDGMFCLRLVAGRPVGASLRLAP